MSLIIRIDVDRPYGKQGLIRHVASRLRSDYYLPRLTWLRYLDELSNILELLNSKGKPAHVFFRRCTLPTQHIRGLIERGGHVIGLHLEDSRSYETFRSELRLMESQLGLQITSFSKHGSGLRKFGKKHYPPYEPVKYLEWGKAASMRVFFGNGENPSLPCDSNASLLYYPSAFWLEPAWRDRYTYPLSWLIREAKQRDVVMLLHPDNVVSDTLIMSEFLAAVDQLPVALALPAQLFVTRK